MDERHPAPGPEAEARNAVACSVTCIGCPMGCPITVTIMDDQVVSTEGQQCTRGAVYARGEVTDPRRMLTTLIAVPGRGRPLPVRTAQPIPKPRFFRALAEIHAAKPVPPIAAGSVILADVAGTGIAVIATDDLP